ncbi:MAG: hypothetical protein HS104_13505 [Polyangiaceae bacterium]|nr:hypothetical protein [Polyangiaceae bacterium]
MVGVLLLGIHAFFAAPQYPMAARAGAAALGTLAFAVIQRTTTKHLPFLAVVAVTQYVFFGFPVFKARRLVGVGGPIPISETSLTYAVWAVVLFLVVVLITARMAKRIGEWLSPVVRRLFPDPRSLTGSFMVRAFSVFSIGLLVVAWFVGVKGRESTSLATVASLVAAEQLIQTILYRDWHATKSPISRAWFFGYTAAASIAGLLTGMLGLALFPWLAALVLGWQLSGRLSTRAIALMFLAFVVLTPAKHLYRQQVWRGGDVAISQRFDVWTAAVEQSWSSDRKTSGHVDAAADRLSALLFVAQAIEWVPRNVGHSGSSRWKLIPMSYIPRFLWPEKPDLTRAYNGEYALSFGLQTEMGIRSTALNLPHVLDGYWAYGWWGVIAVGVIIGGLVGFYEGLFDPANPVLHALGMTYLFKMHAEGHVGLFFTGVPQIFLVSLAIMWFLWAARMFVPVR